MSARLLYDNSMLLCLTGVCLRIARRLGLHKDGTTLGLSPFEVEMRRRLWWQITIFDCKVTELCGLRASQDVQGDTKPPLNVNDSDLTVDMTEAPAERSEITEMVFSRIRAQLGHFLAKTAPPPMSFDSFRSSSMTLSAKDELIDNLQDSLEQEFLRYCDPLQPLHLASSILSRTAICKGRLMVHTPFQYADQGMNIPESESDIIFNNGMKIIEYCNMLHSARNLQGYRWYFGSNFPWDSVIFILMELRRRKAGPNVDYAWSQITQLFQNFPEVITGSGNPLWMAVGIWTINVWEECNAARATPLTAPDFITQLRGRTKSNNAGPPDFVSSGPTDPTMIGGDLLGYDQVDYLNEPLDMALNAYGSLDSDTMFFQPYSMDWAQLDHMMRGTEQ